MGFQFQVQRREADQGYLQNQQRMTSICFHAWSSLVEGHESSIVKKNWLLSFMTYHDMSLPLLLAKSPMVCVSIFILREDDIGMDFYFKIV